MESQGIGNTSLSRQGSSFYSLTLDEVQSQLGNLGKPIASLNLDEFLRTVWHGEAIDNADSHDPAQLAPNPPLNMQSSFSVSRDLSKKTVEEVWRDIQQGKRIRKDEERNQEGQSTFGEMTLEDFLTEAGVTVESDDASNNNAQWTQYQMPPVEQTPHNLSMIMPNQQIQQQTVSASRGLAFADSVYSDTAMSPSALMGTPSDTQAVRNRVGDVMVEKTVERKQKRMIKNRESAARSRERKQAYTHELEIKVSLLEEENARLRKLKELEEELPSAPPPEPKYQLRRTSSAPF